MDEKDSHPCPSADCKWAVGGLLWTAYHGPPQVSSTALPLLLPTQGCSWLLANAGLEGLHHPCSLPFSAYYSPSSSFYKFSSITPSEHVVCFLLGPQSLQTCGNQGITGKLKLHKSLMKLVTLEERPPCSLKKNLFNN